MQEGQLAPLPEQPALASPEHSRGMSSLAPTEISPFKTLAMALANLNPPQLGELLGVSHCELKSLRDRLWLDPDIEGVVLR